VTTVLGRQLHMDPHFFGVKIAVKNAANNGSSVVSVNELRGAANVDSAYQFHKVGLIAMASKNVVSQFSP
jgi:hypothetical protein